MLVAKVWISTYCQELCIITDVLTWGLIQNDFLRKKLILNAYLPEQWKEKLNKTMNSLAQDTFLYGLKSMTRCGGMLGSIPY